MMWHLSTELPLCCLCLCFKLCFLWTISSDSTVISAFLKTEVAIFDRHFPDKKKKKERSELSNQMLGKKPCKLFLALVLLMYPVHPSVHC